MADEEGANPDGNLAQDGTNAECVNSGCSPSYSARYELLPSNPVYCNGMPIHGGDSMWAQTMNQADGGGNNQYYKFFINDYSTLWGCGTGYIQYSQMTTPHWADLIVEWPHFCGIFDCSSLARFGTVTFSNAQYYCASGSHCSPQGQSGEVGLHGDIDTNFKLMINECGCQTGGVLNVDTGLISSSHSFTETWLTSQNT